MKKAGPGTRKALPLSIFRMGKWVTILLLWSDSHEDIVGNMPNLANNMEVLLFWH